MTARIEALMLSIIISGLILKTSGQTNNDHFINGVEYHAMLDGFCAMAALQMNLDYYGAEIDQSLLLNLGWNYGFLYYKTPFFSVAYPDTDPVEEIVFASDKIGFNATVLYYKSIIEARLSLLNYISKDIPVIVQLIPHTVLTTGYIDSANTIIYHDPGDYTNADFDDIENMPFGKGENATMPITDWKKPPYLWGMRQFQIVIVEPGNREVNINWQEIWKRNAGKTMGTIKGQFPAFYGVDGINEVIKDIRNVLDNDITKSVEIVRNFEMCFRLGTGFRRNAAGFLSGQASVLKDENLTLASEEFLKSALYFQEGYNLIGWFINSYDHDKSILALNEFVRILEKIAECEENGAGYLLNASGK